MTGHFEHRGLRVATGIVLILVCMYTLHRAWILGIEYFDGYIYLTNAARLSGDESARFDTIRPPLLSLIQAPAVRYARAMGPANEWLLRAPHLVSSGLSLLALAAVYVVFRGLFGSTLGLLGTLLFSGTRYFVRYGAHVMTDIPVAAITLAAVGLYIRARARRSSADYALCGVTIGLAVLMKYSALLIFPALVLTEIALFLSAKLRKNGDHLEALPDRERLWGLILSGLIAGTIVVITLVAVFFAVFGPAVWSALPHSVANVFTAVRDIPTESWTDHLSMAAVMLSLPLLLLAGAGLVVSCAEPRTHDIVFLCYLAVVGGGLVVFVGHTEARYLLPSVPAIIYFVVRGVEAALFAMQNHFGRSRQRLILPLVAVLVLEVSVQNGLRQAWADREPFFTDDVQRRASLSLLDSRGDHGRLLALGRWHTLFPPKSGPGPMPEDEYWNMFHSSPVVIEYYLGERLAPLPLRAASASRLTPLLGRFLRDGDAVLRLNDVPVTAANMFSAATTNALEVWSVVSTELTRDPVTNRLASEDGHWTGTLEPGKDGPRIIFDQPLGRRHVYVTGNTNGQPGLIGTFSLHAGAAIGLSGIHADAIQSLILQSISVAPISPATAASSGSARN